MIEYGLRFAHPEVLYWLLPILVVVVIARRWIARNVYYHYSMAGSIASAGYESTAWHEHIFAAIRVITLLVLAFLCAKPQLIDKKSSVVVEGIDIMLVLDVSGSMASVDYEDDQRPRIEIAKAEAIRFIEKRTNDAIGVVIFGNDSVSRIPLTLDKSLLKNMIKTLELGIVNPDGTLLATGIVTAANRLKHSKATSKVMILLTDGEPSEGDIDPAVAIEIAKKLGLRIYAIGIGSDQEKLMHHPFYGIIRAPKINSALLTRIAHETGGKFFVARNAKDMRMIYDTIDQLEKTKHDAPIFSHYYDLFLPFVWFLIILVFAQLVLATGWWFGL